jgi:NAD+ diphosphatase
MDTLEPELRSNSQSDSFVRARPCDRIPEGEAKWLLLQDGNVILKADALPSASDLGVALPSPDSLYLGQAGDTPYFADEIAADTPLPDGLSAVNLRSLLSLGNEEISGIAGYAAQMLYWRRTGRYCPVCATPTEARQKDWGRVCPNCGHIGYPRVSPAVLILIHDGDRILLGSKPGWDRFSILAGFVDSAETLEECVRRETNEEVGLTVDDIRYVGSQSWPFPHQLMVGFTACYAGGDIRIDDEELDRAAWFTRDDLPPLPPKISLSRQMIDAWIEKR